MEIIDKNCPKRRFISGFLIQKNTNKNTSTYYQVIDIGIIYK